MIEMFKIKNQIAPPVMDSIFERRIESYNSLIINNFGQKEKDLCIMVLKHLATGLHHYGLYLNLKKKKKTLRTFNH